MPQTTISATYTAFIDACSQPGCPLCRIEHDSVLRYISSIFYEQVTDYNLRDRLRDSLGFCREHAYFAVDELPGNALGIAIIYQDLIKYAKHHLDDTRGGTSPKRRCPACEQRDLSMMRTLSELSKHIEDEAMTSALSNSEGLCLFHMRHALKHTRLPTRRALLLSIEHTILSKLSLELAEFVRKNDYRFAKETFGEERDSWRRAVGIVAGARKTRIDNK
jgi:hypothetical protein